MPTKEDTPDGGPPVVIYAVDAHWAKLGQYIPRESVMTNAPTTGPAGAGGTQHMALHTPPARERFRPAA
ncbi:hypothetical protein [Frankia sp. AgKG'84/4]|uniref:hypothetical protein n=1 Tax=Frankia sp. AgKG'84/4 TaxID=573490 RepID=UPI00200DBDF5|nr:hypothetical protein [Frankia sp. AgKG'84/4]MCL9797568.1 hypothetical protein [Frankia sp. AgKG'84/4]